MSNKEGLFDDSGDEEEMYKPTTEENKEAIKLYKEGKSKQRQGV